MSHRFVWILTVLMALVGTARLAHAQPEPLPLDPDADRLAELDALVAVPGGVIDITDGLMEAIAGMDEAPARNLMFSSSSSPGWGAALTWAKAPNQQKAIDRLVELTGPDEKRTLGMPYSDTTWRGNGGRTGIDLPDGAALLSIDPSYLTGALALIHANSVEAWDRADKNDAAGVSEAMLASIRLCRILMDRETLREKTFAIEQFIQSLERLRDIVYTHPDLYSTEAYLELIDGLDNDEIELEIVRLPLGNRLIAMDLMERTMVPEGGVDQTKFGLVMAAGGGASERPLELFSRTARMNQEGARHVGWYETYDALNTVFGDWWARWETPDLHDNTLKPVTDYQQLPPNGYGMVRESIGGIEDMFELRFRALTELFGTRNAMGVMAFRSRTNRYPPSIRAISPQYVKELDRDPWSVHPRFLTGFEANTPRSRFEKSVAFKYLVPIRDQRWGPREEKIPYEITVLTGIEGEARGSEEAPADETATDIADADAPAGSAQGLDTDVSTAALIPQFTVSFDESVFLLYSVGADYEDDAARPVGPGAPDYLIWPPLPTIMREQGVLR